MTAPADGHWCSRCGVHRTRSVGSLCPCCSPNPQPNPAAPVPRMALDLPTPISTTAGELL